MGFLLARCELLRTRREALERGSGGDYMGRDFPMTKAPLGNVAAVFHRGICPFVTFLPRLQATILAGEGHLVVETLRTRLYHRIYSCSSWYSWLLTTALRKCVPKFGRWSGYCTAASPSP
jgi:hypothetical protein